MFFPTKSNFFQNEEQTLKIMVTSDTHLGFKENHSLRSNDSYEAFSEILQKSKKNNVDFIIHGGDLFDEPEPSQETIEKSVKILKENIFGDKNLNYEVFWDKNIPNYASENMNIDLPIFAINGKNDCPNTNGFSVLDLLHTGNYVRKLL